jgi:DNA (cytosine-5)-methyltransferase 1
MIHNRSKESMEKRLAYRKSIGRTTVPPGTLAEQVQYGKPVTNMPMWRTPDAAAGGSNLPGIQKALDEGHLKRPSGQQIQIRLQDQVKEPRLWPTPVHTDHLMNKSETLEAWTIRAKKKKEENGVNLQYALRHAVQEQKPGGTLNPTWVEWLMGYPTGHTDLKP